MHVSYKDNRHQPNPVRATGNLYQGSEISTLSRSFDKSYTKISLTSEGEAMDSQYTNHTLNANDVFARQSFLVLFDHANEANLADAERVRNLLRKVPHDMLATEWLNMEPNSIESRTYLIDNILPQVILGLEEVLKEAVDHRLVGPEIKPEAVKSEGHDPNFNPINRLAEYLMRNNIRYNNFPETSPYVRELRITAAEMKHEMFMRSDNQSAKLKAMVTQLQEEKLNREESTRLELERRKKCLTVLFETFLPSAEETIQSIAIQTAIRAFSKLLCKLPDTIRSCVVPIFDIQTVDQPPQSYDKTQFMTYLLMFAKPMSADLFDKFMEHMTLCAKEYRSAIDKVGKSNLLANFFVSCDLEQVDVLSRKQMMNLCENYFSSADIDQKEMLQDPREWPVREFHIRCYENREPNVLEDNMESQAIDDNNSAMVDVSLANQVALHSLEEDGAFSGETYHETEEISSLKSEESLTGLENTKIDDVQRREFSLSEEQFTKVSLEFTEEDILRALRKKSQAQPESSRGDARLRLLHGYSSERLSLPQFLHTADCLFRKTSPLSMIGKFEQFLESRKYEVLVPDDQMKAHRQMSKYLLFEDNENRIIQRTFSVLTRDTETPLHLSLSLLDNWIRLYNNRSVKNAWEDAKMELFNQLRRTTNARSEAQDSRTSTENILSSRGSFSPEQDTPNLNPCSETQNAQAMVINRSDFNHLLKETIKRIQLPSKGDDQDRMDALRNLTNHLIVRSTAKRDSVELKTQIRDARRQKWLDDINCACQRTTHSMEPVFRAAFTALVKDALKHGNGRQIGAHVSLLRDMPEHLASAGSSNLLPTDESNKTSHDRLHGSLQPSFQQQCLECVAATPESTAQLLVGKRLQPGPTGTGISFRALRSGKTTTAMNRTDAKTTSTHCHAALDEEENVCQQGSSSREEEDRRSPCVAVPIPKPSGELIGILGVDASANQVQANEFTQHEITFYKTVAEHIGQAYSTITYQRSMAYLVATAFNWLTTHIDKVMCDMTFYSCRDEVMAEVDEATDGRHRRVSLRQVVQRSGNQPAVLIPDQPTVITRHRSDYLCSHLFSSVDSSEPSECHLLGQHYLVLPVRGPDTTTVGVVELSTLSRDSLYESENMDQIMKMMNILTVALSQVNPGESGSGDNEVKLGNDDKNVNGEDCFTVSTEKVTGDSTGQSSLAINLLNFQAIDVFQLLGKAEFATITNELIKQVHDIRQLHQTPSPVARQLLDAIKTILHGDRARDDRNRSMEIEEELMEMFQFEPTSTNAVEAVEQQWLQLTDIRLYEQIRQEAPVVQLLQNWLRTCLLVVVNARLDIVD